MSHLVDDPNMSKLKLIHPNRFCVLPRLAKAFETLDSTMKHGGLMRHCEVTADWFRSVNEALQWNLRLEQKKH